MRQFILAIFLFFHFLLHAQTIYVSTSDADLFKVDVPTSTVSYIGNSGQALLDIAMTPDGVLFGIGTYGLVQVSTVDASITEVIGVDRFWSSSVGLVSDNNGDLYAGAYELYKLDWPTGQWNELMQLSPYGTGGDVTFYNGTMYVTGSGNQLGSVDFSTMSSSYSGVITLNSYAWGITSYGHPVLDSCSGELISGASSQLVVGSGNQLFFLDPVTRNTSLYLTLPMQNGDLIFGATSTDESAQVYQPVLTDRGIPNVFTPNGDGTNDEFIPLKDRGQCRIGGSYEIYDRWGVKIFEGDLATGWNGKDLQGNDCMSGVYYYIIRQRSPTSQEYDATGFTYLFR